MTFDKLDVPDGVTWQECIEYLSNHGNQIVDASAFAIAYNLLIECSVSECADFIAKRDSSDIRRLVELTFSNFRHANPKNSIYGNMHETINAISFVWRAASSIAVLEKRSVAGWRKEVERFADEFYSSEYVLFVARLFSLEGHSVKILEESGQSGLKTPDLLVCDKFYVECKSLNVQNIRKSFEKGRKQIRDTPEKRPGIISIDILEDIDLEDNDSRKKLESAVKKELTATRSVNFVGVTQSRRININTEVVQNPILVALYENSHPEGPRYTMAPDDVSDVFGSLRTYVV